MTACLLLGALCAGLPGCADVDDPAAAAEAAAVRFTAALAEPGTRSLGLVMGLVVLLSWLAQSVTGLVTYNEEQLRDLEEPLSWGTYISSAEFWNRTLQNWQSELLAVASMVVLSVCLRQRGSPESKPVGSAHTATGVEG
ncbi:hypothetical protein GCM10010272_43480 [Streptomyces lateritius]|nr:hypothetical protein GCM10010272_43480 [Streptomyces lateritius]